MSLASERAEERTYRVYLYWCQMVNKPLTGPDEEGMTDLLADLMHLAASPHYQLDFDELVERARFHFDAEHGDGDDFANIAV